MVRIWKLDEAHSPKRPQSAHGEWLELYNDIYCEFVTIHIVFLIFYNNMADVPSIMQP